MTVAADYTPKLYTANGTTTVFPWTADYDSTYGTLIVTEVNASGETVQTYVEGTDYNIQGKEVVFVTAPANGKKIKIDRHTYRGQQTDYIEGEDFPAEDFESSLDRLHMIAQEQDHAIAKNKEDIAELRDDLTDETTARVAADEELDGKITTEKNRAKSVEGNLDNLNTTAKTNLVAAINEVKGDFDDLNETVSGFGDVVGHDADEFATAAQGEKADSALQPADLGTGTLTLKQGGVTKGTFNANASTDKVIELDAGGGGSPLGEAVFIEVSQKVVSASDDFISFDVASDVEDNIVYYPVVTFLDNYPANRGLLPFISKTAYFFSGTSYTRVTIPVDEKQTYITSGSSATLQSITICLIPIGTFEEGSNGECFGVTNGQYYGVNFNDLDYDRYYTRVETEDLIAASKSFKGTFDKTKAYSAGDIVLAGANNDTYYLIKQDIAANTYNSNITAIYSDTYATAISIGTGRIPYAGQATGNIYLTGITEKPYLSDSSPTGSGIVKSATQSVNSPYYNAETGEFFAPSGIHGLNRKYFSSVEVETTDWTSDNTYTDYPYKASVDLDFTAADAIPEVCFSLEDATSGEFAPVCDYNGTTGFLTVWAKTVPNGKITIEWVKLEW